FKVCGFDDRLSEKSFQLVRARGRVAFVEVAEVGQNSRNALPHSLDHSAPGLQVLFLRALYDVEAREVARAHPAYVNKVCGGVLCQMPHFLAGEPLPFDQSERDVVLGKKIEHRLPDPIMTAKLKAKADV